MKQKKIGTDLYVFDTSAYQLTKDLDAENIYIQQELIPGYEKLNSSSVNAKIKPINYKLNIIQKPVWGDYIYADEEKEDLEAKIFLNGVEVEDVFYTNTNIKYLDEYFGAEIISVKDSEGNEIPVVCTSSDESVFVIAEDSGGDPIISAIGFGTATLTVAWSESENYKAGTKQISVKAGPSMVSGDSGSTDYLAGKDTIEISMQTEPTLYIKGFGEMIGNAVFTSSDDNVLTADQSSGMMSFHVVSAGTCTLAAEWIEGENYGAGTATWNVVVTD